MAVSVGLRGARNERCRGNEPRSCEKNGDEREWETFLHRAPRNPTETASYAGQHETTLIKGKMSDIMLERRFGLLNVFIGILIANLFNWCSRRTERTDGKAGWRRNFIKGGGKGWLYPGGLLTGGVWGAYCQHFAVSLRNSSPDIFHNSQDSWKHEK